MLKVLSIVSKRNLKFRTRFISQKCRLGLRLFCDKKDNKGKTCQDAALIKEIKEVCPKNLEPKKTLTMTIPVQEMPCIDRKVGPEECLRPYTNPCPPYPPCDPTLLPVHPCREKFPPKVVTSGPKVKEELTHCERQLLMILTGIVSGVVLYKVFTMPKEGEVAKLKRPRCVLRPQFIEKSPPEATDIPHETKYLIVGGGTAAFSAFRTIKNNDPSAKIMIVTEEPYSPYMRPPLTKDMFFNPNIGMSRDLLFKPKGRRNRKIESIFYEPDEFFTPIKDFRGAEDGITVIKGYGVESIDYVNKKAKITEGPDISYDKCLLATGARPAPSQVFDFNTDDVKEKVTNFKTVYDYLEIEDVINCGAKTIGIIGGTPLACELACGLVRRGVQPVLILECENVMSDKWPCYLSKAFAKKLENLGVKIINKTKLSDAMIVNQKLKLVTCERKCIFVDHAVVAFGTTANTDLAEASGIETDPVNGGYVVDPEMRIRSDLFAAGDCASVFNPNLGRKNVQGHDHALLTGRIAGMNMTGSKEYFDKQAVYWSEFAPLTEVHSVGLIDAKLPTVGVFLDNANVPDEPPDMRDLDDPRTIWYDKNQEYNKGVVYYLNEKKRVVGILLWNLHGRQSLAQTLLKKKGLLKYDQLDEVSKMFRMEREMRQ